MQSKLSIEKPSKSLVCFGFVVAVLFCFVVFVLFLRRSELSIRSSWIIEKPNGHIDHRRYSRRLISLLSSNHVFSSSKSFLE